MKLQQHGMQWNYRIESGRRNPVEKVLSVVTGCDGNLLIDEIPEEHNPVVRGAGAFEHSAFLITHVSFCNFIFIFFFPFYSIFDLFPALGERVTPSKSEIESFKMETNPKAQHKF